MPAYAAPNFERETTKPKPLLQHPFSGCRLFLRRELRSSGRAGHLDIYSPAWHLQRRPGRVLEEDCWLCPWGKKATFTKVKVAPKNNIRKKLYFTTRKDCQGYLYKESCIGKSHEKKVEITYYREEYKRVIARLKSRYGRKMKGLRQATVEPVLGTLINFMGLNPRHPAGTQRNAFSGNGL